MNVGESCRDDGEEEDTMEGIVDFAEIFGVGYVIEFDVEKDKKVD